MIAVLLAPGFEEIEAVTAVDILRRAELAVCTVAVARHAEALKPAERTKVVRGSHGLSLLCDQRLEECDPANLDLLVLPGGIPGTLELERSPVARGYIEFAMSQSLPVGAISTAPSILGQMGLLEGRRVTCYPGFDALLAGACYTGAPVEIDENLITANGPGMAMEFALALVEKILGRERADILKASL